MNMQVNTYYILFFSIKAIIIQQQNLCLCQHTFIDLPLLQVFGKIFFGENIFSEHLERPLVIFLILLTLIIISSVHQLHRMLIQNYLRGAMASKDYMSGMH